MTLPGVWPSAWNWKEPQWFCSANICTISSHAPRPSLTFFASVQFYEKHREKKKGSRFLVNFITMHPRLLHWNAKPELIFKCGTLTFESGFTVLFNDVQEIEETYTNSACIYKRSRTERDTRSCKMPSSASDTIHFQNGTIINAHQSIARPLSIAKQGKDLTSQLAEDIAEEMAENPDDPELKVIWLGIGLATNPILRWWLGWN